MDPRFVITCGVITFIINFLPQRDAQTRVVILYIMFYAMGRIIFRHQTYGTHNRNSRIIILVNHLTFSLRCGIGRRSLITAASQRIGRCAYCGGNCQSNNRRFKHYFFYAHRNPLINISDFSEHFYLKFGERHVSRVGNINCTNIIFSMHINKK